MPHPYDATVKDLVERYPADWLARLGLEPVGGVEVVDADISTVSAQADKVLRVADPKPWLLSLEFQAGRDPLLPARLLKYNVLLHDRHRMPAQSAVILLRPEADGREMSGSYGYEGEPGVPSIVFGFRVCRVWEMPTELLLTGGTGTIPLAPISKVQPAELPGVIRRMEDRLEGVAREEAAHLWASAYVLMGLRYTKDFANNLFKGIKTMHESATYQAILEEGGEREARTLLLRLGKKRFGPAPARVVQAIDGITDLDRLEALSERILDINGWDELI